MAYVAPREKFTMLSNALSGVNKGLNDFATMKLERDKMAQQQQQFDANLAFGFDKLDEQIRQFDVGTKEHRELTEARMDLEKTLKREGIVSAEKIATQRVSLGYSQLSQRKKEHDYAAEQEARLESSISQYITSFDDIEPLVSPEKNPEEFNRLYPGGVNDPNYAVAWQKFERETLEQSNALAQQLSPSGKITPEIRQRADAIIRDKKGYQDRVVIRRTEMAKAKNARYAMASFGSKAQQSVMGGSKSAIDQVGEWKPTYSTAPVYEVPSPVGMDMIESATPGEDPNPTRYIQKPNNSVNMERIAAEIRKIDNDQQQAMAFRASLNLSTAMGVMQDAMESSHAAQKEARKNYIEKAEYLDALMGNSNGQVVQMATIDADYIINTKNNEPLMAGLAAAGSFRPGLLSTQMRTNLQTGVTAPSPLDAMLSAHIEARRSGVSDVTAGDDIEDQVLEAFPDGATMDSVERSQPLSEMGNRVQTALGAEEAELGRKLTARERGNVILSVTGGK